MTKTAQRPPITVSSADFERLDNLVAAIERSQPDVAAYLADELDRAKVAPKEDLPKSLVVMGADVTFRDDITGDVHHKQLVYPDQGISDLSQCKYTGADADELAARASNSTGSGPAPGAPALAK